MNFKSHTEFQLLLNEKYKQTIENDIHRLSMIKRNSVTDVICNTCINIIFSL